MAEKEYEVLLKDLELTEQRERDLFELLDGFQEEVMIKKLRMRSLVENKVKNEFGDGVGHWDILKSILIHNERFKDLHAYIYVGTEEE